MAANPLFLQTSIATPATGKYRGPLRAGPDISVMEYPTMADAEDAIRRLDGTEIHGVPVRVEVQVGILREAVNCV